MRSTISTVRVQWRCRACGHKHRWQWECDTFFAGPLTMTCDACEAQSKRVLVFDEDKGCWRARKPERVGAGEFRREG